jgi:hypothetical protein
MKILTTALIIIVAPLLGDCAAQTDSRRVPTPTQKYILERIHKLTELDTLFAVEKIEDAPASTANIPFLEKQLEGKNAIKVTLKPGKLKLKPPPGKIENEDDYNDAYNDRQFVLLLDADAKTILSIRSRISKQDPNIHPEPPVAEIERLYGPAGDIYLSFPAHDPKVTFLEALYALQKVNIIPQGAQQIDAFYVMYDETADPRVADPRADWVITMRGPPFFAAMPDVDGTPIWQLNHMRSFVDAVTGAWLRSSSNPQPSH